MLIRKCTEIKFSEYDNNHQLITIPESNFRINNNGDVELIIDKWSLFTLKSKLESIIEDMK